MSFKVPHWRKKKLISLDLIYFLEIQILTVNSSSVNQLQQILISLPWKPLHKWFIIMCQISNVWWSDSCPSNSNQRHLWGYDYFAWWNTCTTITRKRKKKMKIFWLCCKNKFLSSVPYLNLLKSRFNHCPNSAIQ